MSKRKVRAGEAFRKSFENAGGNLESLQAKRRRQIQTAIAVVTSADLKILDRWHQAATRCLWSVDQAQDLDAVEFTAFPSWGSEPILDALDLLCDLLGPRLANLGIDPEPFYRAYERSRSWQSVRVEGGIEDVPLQDLARSAIRAGLDFSKAAQDRIGTNQGGAAADDPPKPEKKKGRPPKNTDRDERIAELHQKHPDWSEGEIALQVNREGEGKGWNKVSVGAARKVWNRDSE